MLGKFDGSDEGEDVGALVGRIDVDGALEKKEENVGRLVGDIDGNEVCVGTNDGKDDGKMLGMLDGLFEGSLE